MNHRPYPNAARTLRQVARQQLGLTLYRSYRSYRQRYVMGLAMGEH